VAEAAQKWVMATLEKTSAVVAESESPRQKLPRSRAQHLLSVDGTLSIFADFSLSFAKLGCALGT
jgi:hypothetical protein